MLEKNNNNSNSLGICQKLFDFFTNSLIASCLKRVTLGQTLPQGYGSLSPAKSNGELTVHQQDYENSKHNSGSEIQVLFNQSEMLESWTPVDPGVSKSEQPPGSKKEIHLVQEKIKPQGKSSQDVPEPDFTVPKSRSGPKKTISVKDSDGEDKNKMKGKNIPIQNLTLAIEDEELKRTPRRLRPPLSVALNINEKSDEFIRSRKEAMSRNMGMETKKKKKEK